MITRNRSNARMARAVKQLLLAHKRETSPDSRSRRLLEEWLSPSERSVLEQKGYFDVVGGTTGKRYRIFPATSMNVIELDERGCELRGLCFLPRGNLPIGDTMLAQKIALETAEPLVETVAGRFTPVCFRPGRSIFSR
jgi:hypothetical protein